MISQELLQKFIEKQPAIWTAVTNAFSEAVEQSITLTSGEAIISNKADILANFSQEALLVQFSFSALQDHAQLLIINQDTFGEFAILANGKSPESIDESIIPDVRSIAESIVQGLCIASGKIKNETVAASDLQIRYQVPTLNPNLQEEHAQIPLTITGPDWNGSGFWLVDQETLNYLMDNGEVQEVAQIIQFPQPAGTPNTPRQNETGGLDRLLDIPLEISVELGRVKMLVKDVVELSTGSIVEIEKSAGEPVDILVNGRLVAHGEVVVIEDNFGVRITEILSKQDRLNKLNEVA